MCVKENRKSLGVVSSSELANARNPGGLDEDVVGGGYMRLPKFDNLPVVTALA